MVDVEERGPKLARIYATELSKQQSATPIPPPTTSATADATSISSSVAPSDTLPNPYENATTKGQQVLILRDGFTGWQALYRDDPILTENFDLKVWGDYAQ